MWQCSHLHIQKSWRHSPPKKKHILLSFTHPHAIPNHPFLSSAEHKRRLPMYGPKIQWELMGTEPVVVNIFQNENVRIFFCVEQKTRKQLKLHPQHLEEWCSSRAPLWKKNYLGKNWWLWWKQLLFVYNYRNNFHAVNTKMFFVHSFNTFKNIINIFMIDFHLRRGLSNEMA